MIRDRADRVSCPLCFLSTLAVILAKSFGSLLRPFDEAGVFVFDLAAEFQQHILVFAGLTI
jgi:hypothetical protein